MARRGVAWAGAALGAGYVAAVLLLDPFGPGADDRALACPVHALTGGWCPGCGATRASWLVLHGHLLRSFRYNALLLPAVVYLVARWTALVAPAVPWPTFVRSPTEIPRDALVGLAALVTLFTVARNLPLFEPWLAPPG